MPRPKRSLSGSDYKSKTEKQIDLPKVYTKLPKTERMVNLPRIYYNKFKYFPPLYKATGIGLSPNIDGLRFYDSGLIYNGKKSFYSENGQYAIWYNTIGVEAWYIGLIANIGTFIINSWTKIGATDITTGSYRPTLVSTTGTVTISAI